MNERTSKLYTGENLTKQEEIQLIHERIAELQLNIDVAKIEIKGAEESIVFFKNRLRELGE